MASANRETVRDALAALLNTELAGTGKPVQAVYGYLESDFEDQSPVVMVLTAGIRRTRPYSSSNEWESFMRFELLAWVLDADTGSGWTDQNVDDKVDEVEAAIADVIQDNAYNEGVWHGLSYDPDRDTAIVRVTIGSTPYVLERIPIVADVYDDE